MLRLNKLTDYAVVILGRMLYSAGAEGKSVALSAAALAAATGVSEPTVAKILKDLVKSGLVTSVRGAQGGYVLASNGADLTVRHVIEAVEGPIAVTDCVDTGSSACPASAVCPCKGNWDAVNAAIVTALDGILVRDMVRSHTDKPTQFVTLQHANVNRG